MAKGKKYPNVSLLYPEKDKNGPWKWNIRETINGKFVREQKNTDQYGRHFEHAEDAWNDRCRRMNELINGTGGYDEISNITFKDVFDDYIKSPKADAKAPGTVRKHTSVWRNHIEPAFADKKINSTTVDDMYCFLLDKYNSGKYSYEYVEAFIKVFYLLYGYALSKQWITFEKYNDMFNNEASRLKMPPRRREDPEDNDIITYSDVELYQIEQIFARERFLHLYPTYMIARYAGLRKGEIFGLRWENIDWRHRLIKINCQMQRDEVRKVYSLTPPKTKNAYRDVLIPDILYKYLRDLFKQRSEEKKKYGQFYKNTEKVYDAINKNVIESGDFINRKPTGELITINSTKSVSTAIKKELEKELHYHWFRHTYATMCAINNMDENMLCSQMGHDKLETTRKYYLDTKNATLIDRTRTLLDKIFINTEVDVEAEIIKNKLDKELDIPSEALISDSNVSDAAQLLKTVNKEKEMTALVINKKIINTEDGHKVLVLVFNDGYEVTVDITDI